jgi:hypothetical protein
MHINSFIQAHVVFFGQKQREKESGAGDYRKLGWVVSIHLSSCGTENNISNKLITFHFIEFIL